MPEYDFTTGTKIFVIATITLLVAFVIALLFESTGTFALFFGGTLFCAVLGIYAAATDMSYTSSYQESRFVFSNRTDASIAQISGIIGGFFAFFPLLLILLAPELGENNLMLASLVGAAGGLFLIIGGVVAGREYEE